MIDSVGSVERLRTVCSVWSVALLLYIHITLVRATCTGNRELTATTTYSALSDGSHQQDYDSNLNCTWLLRGPTGSTLRLEFTSFSLETADPKTGKCYDYVEIVDGMDSSDSLGRHCGLLAGRISQPFVSTKSTMLLRFYTDKAISAQGFTVRYRAEAVPIKEPKIFANNTKDLHLEADGKILLKGEVVVGSNSIPLLATLQQLNRSITNYQNQQKSDDTLSRITQLEESINALVFALGHPSLSNTSILHPKCSGNCSGNGICTFQYNSTAAEWEPACSCYPGYLRPTCLSRVQTLEGDGSDGTKIISKSENFTTCVALSGSAVTGSTVIAINYVVPWLKDGDEILVIQMQGQTAGLFEFNRVQKVSRSTLHLTHPLVHNYSTSIKTRAQVVRVPNYSEFRIKKTGKLVAQDWNGTSGGIVAIRAKTFTIDEGGSIDANGKGFRGGPKRDGGGYWNGVTGESWQDTGFSRKDRNGRNAGGGGSSYCYCLYIAGGGSYGSVGLSSMGTPTCGGGAHGQSGAVYGSSSLTKLFVGSGGGGGCSYHVSSSTYMGHGKCVPNSGSNGGGIIYIGAATATLHGTLTSAGNNNIAKATGNCRQTVGGPGSGGSILLRATTLTLDAATGVFNISGGGRVQIYSTTYTGTGGSGRARVDFETLNGYPHHSASAKTIQSSFPEIGYWGSVAP